MFTSITKELVGTKMTKTCSLTKVDDEYESNSAASQQTLKISF